MGRRWGIIGFGEVGAMFARQISDQTHHPVAVTDPLLNQEPRPPHIQRRLERAKVQPYSDLAELVAHSDVVLSTVTVEVARQVAGRMGQIWSGDFFIDFNSIAPRAKRELASVFPNDGYVDGAILGAISGEGAATPLAVAGPRAAEAHTALKDTGFRASLTGRQVGGASALKLCRSVFMKGLECLFVETLLAAQQFDLQKPVLETIEQTLQSYGLEPMARMLVTTHAVHCGRRSREMVGAVEMLEEMELPSVMSDAARDFLQKSQEAGLTEHFRKVLPDGLDEVLNFLTQHYREPQS